MLDMPRIKNGGIRGRRGGRGDQADHSMQSEALNTHRNQLSRGSDQKLRHTKIEFISAGPSKPLTPAEPEVSLAGITLDDVAKDLDGDVGRLNSISKQFLDDVVGRDSLAAISDDNTEPFIIGTLTAEPAIAAQPARHSRSPSFTPSNSSEEVIVYPGRGQQGSSSSKLCSQQDTTTSSSDQQRTLLMLTMGDESSVRSCQQILRDTMEDPRSTRIVAKLSQRNRHKPRYIKDEDSPIDDYIANIEEHDAISRIAYYDRELEDVDDEVGNSSTFSLQKPSISRACMSNSNVRPRAFARTVSLGLNTVAYLRAPDDGFSPDDTNNKQYSQAGQSPHEAPWDSSSSATDGNSIPQATRPKVEKDSLLKTSQEDFVDAGSDEDIALDGRGDETDDEIDVERRQTHLMTDESIAKLLAKQEEIGIDSSELLLFDDTPGQGMATHLPWKNRSTFSRSSLFTDAYDNFDIMDSDRPSLARNGKGRKAGAIVVSDLEGSNSESEAFMFRARENDRAKKKERKDERQALRAEGVLGRKNGKPDLKLKYKEGMDHESVVNRIQNFLRSDNSSLALPPMDKSNRRAVHELANACNLKSKSAGSGNKRFPILYKTPRSSLLDESRLAAVKARLSRRYLPRTDLHAKNRASFHNRPGRDGFNNASVSYRDGDVVGASAPELGTDNKGRAMLEKMGWSTGTALGALNNKGILQPVSHVVKTTKAGLG